MVTEAPSRYSQNAFRVLGLPMAASSSEIQLRADEICVREKLGKTCRYEYDFPWMGPLERTEESARDALHRLSDPIQRAREELAWFWVWGPQDKEALLRLSKNDKAGALHIWESQQATGETAVVAAFNQTILMHSTVIGEELFLSDGMGSLVQLESDETHWKNWRLALEGWRALVNEEQFWLLLKSIAKTRGDARLADSTIEEFRGSLPGEVLKPSLAFLQQAVQGHELIRTKRHVEAIRQVGFPEELFQPWFAESLRGYSNTLREACEATIHTLEEQHIEELEPSAVAPACLRLHQQLKDRAQEALSLGELLDAENHTEFVVEKDQYGETLRQLAILMANKGHTYTDAMRLVEEALRWAVSPSMQAQLKADRKTLEELLAATGQNQAASADTAVASEAGKTAGVQADQAPVPEQDEETSKVLDVKLNAQEQYSYHRVCCCCLARTDDVETVQSQRTEHRVMGNVTHTLRVTLPFCKTCQGHAGEDVKRTIWWLVVTVGVALLSFLTLDIPGANWLLPVLLTLLGNGITVLCLNKWLPRKPIVSPHVSRGMAVQMHALEEHSFMLRFLNVYFGRTFIESNRAIVLEKTLVERPKSFLGVLQVFNDRYALATSIIAGFLFLVVLAALSSSASTHRSASSQRIQWDSTPQRSYQKSSQREIAGQALDRERTTLNAEQQALERDIKQLENIEKQINALAVQINAIDRVYNVTALPAEIYNQRLQLVVQHNALIDTHEQWQTELVKRVENFEARRLSFNAKVATYNQRMRR